MQNLIVNRAIDWISDQLEGFHVEMFVHLDGEPNGTWLRANSVHVVGGTVEIEGETTDLFSKKTHQICAESAVKSSRLTPVANTDDDLPF